MQPAIPSAVYLHGSMIPLRLLMGCHAVLQGLGMGLMGDTNTVVRTLTAQPYGWLWIPTLFCSGLWVLLAAICQWHCLRHEHLYGRHVHERLCRLSESRFYSYFFEGFVWIALGYQAWSNMRLEIFDLIAPLYVAFLGWVAFLDTARQRSRELCRLQPDAA